MRKHKSEFEEEQKIFLGGQVSEKDSFYKDYAMMNPDDAFALWFLQNQDRLEKLSEKEAVEEILKVMARFEYMKQLTELSHLSMKLGDVRTRKSAKKLSEKLKELEVYATSQ